MILRCFKFWNHEWYCKCDLFLFLLMDLLWHAEGLIMHLPMVKFRRKRMNYLFWWNRWFPLQDVDSFLWFYGFCLFLWCARACVCARSFCHILLIAMPVGLWPLLFLLHTDVSKKDGWAITSSCDGFDDICEGKFVSQRWWISISCVLWKVAIFFIKNCLLALLTKDNLVIFFMKCNPPRGLLHSAKNDLGAFV